MGYSLSSMSSHVLLDLRKAYGTVDRERLLVTLKMYGASHRMCGLLETFWDSQQVVPRYNGFHGLALLSTRNTTQHGLVYPMIFNVVVDNVIRTWLDMTIEDQRVDHDGLVETIG